MPNHFHLLVKTKKSDVFENIISPNNPDGRNEIKYSHHFKNLFQSYTKSYNKVYGRMGSLFNQRFKRKEIRSDYILPAVIIYIHLNPVLHGFCKSPEQWKFSSYNAYLIHSGKTKVAIDEGLAYFDNIENFCFCHQERMPQEKINKLEEGYFLE
jgi:REP element-mobilizing transposase RayT